MSEFTKLGGYLIEGQPEVAHDNTLSGNGLEGSPLGLSEQVSEVNDLVHSNSGIWNEVSAKLDTTAFSDVSGSFLTAVPEGYATTADLTGKQDTLTFGYNESNAISSINESAIAGGGSAPTYGYTDNGLISAIDTSGLYATSALEAESANVVKDHGTLGYDLSSYLSQNTSYFYWMPANSPWTTADYATGIFSPLQYATGACLAMDNPATFKAYYKGNEWFVSNTVGSVGQMLRGEVHKSRGVHISGATTAGYGFDLSIHSVSGKNDTANGYNWKLERGCVSGKDSNGQWRYGHAEDAALRAVSSCDMHESAFEYDASDNITAYNGSAFKAGDELPSGVMNTSALEYNAVNEISGYNGSAIAQYGAEKQWLVHDDTLVHAANSAQYALGVNLSAVAKLLGVDETVLQDNIANSATTFTLSEPAGNFNRLRLYDSYGTIAEVSGNNNRITWTFDRTHSNGTRMNRCYTITSNNGIDWNEVNVYGWNQTAYTGALTLNGGTNWYLETVKIIGIGRKA